VLASFEFNKGDDSLNVSSNSDDPLAVAAMRVPALDFKEQTFLAVRSHPENELI